MRTLGMIVLGLVIGSCVLGQVKEKEYEKDRREYFRKKRKEERRQEEERQKQLTQAMLENHRFVLEADFISDQYGKSIPVNQNLNFVLVDSTTATFQFGDGVGIGYNWLGGVTIDGRVTGYKLKKVRRRRGNFYTVTVNILGSTGSYFIFINVSPLGNADATIRSNQPGALRFSGDLVPLSRSDVYKGRPVY